MSDDLVHQRAFVDYDRDVHWICHRQSSIHAGREQACPISLRADYCKPRVYRRSRSVVRPLGKCSLADGYDAAGSEGARRARGRHGCFNADGWPACTATMRLRPAWITSGLARRRRGMTPVGGLPRESEKAGQRLGDSIRRRRGPLLTNIVAETFGSIKRRPWQLRDVRGKSAGGANPLHITGFCTDGSTRNKGGRSVRANGAVNIVEAQRGQPCRSAEDQFSERRTGRI